MVILDQDITSQEGAFLIVLYNIINTSKKKQNPVGLVQVSRITNATLVLGGLCPVSRHIVLMRTKVINLLNRVPERDSLTFLVLHRTKRKRRHPVQNAFGLHFVMCSTKKVVLWDTTHKTNNVCVRMSTTIWRGIPVLYIET